MPYWNNDHNHDGKTDGRDYWDDLGGAHYFRPPDGVSDGLSLGVQVFIAIIQIVFGVGLVYAVIKSCF